MVDPIIDELATLGRIIQTVKRFRQLASGAKPDPKSENAYLKQHLSNQDWLFWKQLQAEPPETLVDTQEPSTDGVLSYQQFRRLLHEYRRAGFESYKLWCQMQSK